jgi:hypothetical protein
LYIAQLQLSKLRQERHLQAMANTYTQIYIHAVFAVEGRQSLISPEHNDELQKYICGIVSAQKSKVIAINNMPITCTSFSASNPIWHFLTCFATSKPTLRDSLTRSDGSQAVLSGKKDSERSLILVHKSVK